MDGWSVCNSMIRYDRRV